MPSDAAEAVDRCLDCRKRLGLNGWHALFCTLEGEPLWDSYVRTLCKRLAAKAGSRSASTPMASGTAGRSPRSRAAAGGDPAPRPAGLVGWVVPGDAAVGVSPAEGEGLAHVRHADEVPSRPCRRGRTGRRGPPAHRTRCSSAHTSSVPCGSPRSASSCGGRASSSRTRRCAGLRSRRAASAAPRRRWRSPTVHRARRSSSTPGG